MSMDRKSVEQIIEAIGGAENIEAVTHCVTRLRFVLRDDSKVDEAALESKGISIRKVNIKSLSALGLSIKCMKN